MEFLNSLESIQIQYQSDGTVNLVVYCKECAHTFKNVKIEKSSFLGWDYTTAEVQDGQKYTLPYTEPELVEEILNEAQNNNFNRIDL